MLKTVIRYAVVVAIVGAVLGLAQSARAQSNTPPAQPAAKSTENKVHGVIEAIDLTAGTITIKHEKRELNFKLAADIKVTGETRKQKMTTADLKKGDDVWVHYTEQGTTLVATHIGHAGPEKGKKKD